MDHKALAETYVDLWRYIGGNFEAKEGHQEETSVVNMVFEQTCKRIISDLIGKQRQGVPPKEETRSEEKPTEKQIAYAEKLGCHFAETLTRRGLSKWIDEHKND